MVSRTDYIWKNQVAKKSRENPTNAERRTRNGGDCMKHYIYDIDNDFKHFVVVAPNQQEAKKSC